MSGSEAMNLIDGDQIITIESFKLLNLSDLNHVHFITVPNKAILTVKSVHMALIETNEYKRCWIAPHYVESVSTISNSILKSFKKAFKTHT